MVTIEMENYTHMKTVTNTIRYTLAGLFTALVLGCSSTPSEPQAPQPMKVSGTMSATTILNPDLKGGYRPLNVKVFYLKSNAAFSKASFTDIYKHTDQVLGPDILHITSHQLLPGQSLRLSESVQPGLKYIGVVGAFRNLEGANWKDIKAIPLRCDDCEGPGLWSPISIKAERLAISLDLGGGATIESVPADSQEDKLEDEGKEQETEPDAKSGNNADFSKSERR